jgi:hypothetical protein
LAIETNEWCYQEDSIEVINRCIDNAHSVLTAARLQGMTNTKAYEIVNRWYNEKVCLAD